ncbi:MAG: hypothetical protein BGO12_15180 [Verrucomicrobia bacterium 61-8]|nr:MAG: hypothetical protein BGO12_15180 [Verrucomicrobia bacterium 61-8]
MPLTKRMTLRIVGILAIMIGAGALAIALLNMPNRLSGGRDLGGLFSLAALLVTLGAGSALGMSWAGYFLALGGSIYGIAMILGSLVFVPFPWSLINVALGCIFCIPAMVFLTTDRQKRPSR